MPEDISPPLPRLPSKAVLCGIVFAAFVLTFSVYGASLGNDFVRWDDGLLIYENDAVREMSFASLKKIFTTYDPELYIPLTLFTYQVDYLLGGAHPFIYHLGNLVLHTLNVLLVAWLFWLLSIRKGIALLAGVLFAIHPLHTEAVAWASARKDLLSAFFFLGSLIGYLYYVRHAEQAPRRASTPPSASLRAPLSMTCGAPSTGSGQAVSKHAIFLFSGSLLLFFLGLLAKVMVLTLPLVLLLIDWYRGRREERRMLLEKVPFFLLSILFGIIALFGKSDVTASATLLETILMAGKSTTFYLAKFFAPVQLSVLYPYTGTIRFSSPDFFLPALLVVVLIGFAWYARRWGRGVPFGIAFFLVTLLPTFVNFSKGGDYYFASDRYAYLPSLGLLFVVGWFLHALQQRENMAVLVGVFIVGFAALAYRQSLVWADTETLFRNVLAHYPNSHRARNNLGNAYRRQNLLEEAIVEFQAALAVREHPKTLSNLGAVYRKQGRIAEALAQYEKAIRIAPDDPEPHFGLGIVYAATGAFEKALASYERALALDPAYADVLNNLGALYVERGEIDRAIDAYQRAIAVSPHSLQSRFNLAVAYAKKGLREEAIAAYREAIRIEPRFVSAHINLALLLYEGGDIMGAREEFEEVLRLDPENPGAREALRQLRGPP